MIGRSGTLDGRPFTIVGGSPRGFFDTLPLGRSADVSVPLLARLAPGEPYHAVQLAWRVTRILIGGRS